MSVGGKTKKALIAIVAVIVLLVSGFIAGNAYSAYSKKAAEEKQQRELAANSVGQPALSIVELAKKCGLDTEDGVIELEGGVNDEDSYKDLQCALKYGVPNKVAAKITPAVQQGEGDGESTFDGQLYEWTFEQKRIFESDFGPDDTYMTWYMSISKAG